ncbi:MAG: ABC transporter ATP-binding protein [Chloroflexi bacterium]|nr:ABC transporter ATP-binding protein [Chloroflexota bacterium]
MALARALVIRPRLLLLDEPLSHLDRSLREELRHVIRSLQREVGITTLFVTHDQTEAVALADRIGVLMQGRLRQLAPPQAFYEQPIDVEMARFFGAGNFLAGVKRGQIVQTCIGDLGVQPSPLADGPVTLAIRPEAIELESNGGNSFTARVQMCGYSIPVSECSVTIKETPLKITLPPYQRLQANENIIVHLPKERISVLSENASLLLHGLAGNAST